MKLSSLAFGDYQLMPAKYTADGDNVSPPLDLSDVPKTAKSLVLLCHDPDASNGGDWVHWLVWNIPVDTDRFNEAEQPKGVAGTNSFGSSGYGGPDPAAGSGSHRYVFELFALDTSLPLAEGADRAEVEKALHGHILAQSMWVGTFERPTGRD